MAYNQKEEAFSSSNKRTDERRVFEMLTLRYVLDETGIFFPRRKKHKRISSDDIKYIITRPKLKKDDQSDMYVISRDNRWIKIHEPEDFYPGLSDELRERTDADK